MTTEERRKNSHSHTAREANARTRIRIRTHTKQNERWCIRVCRGTKHCVSHGLPIQMITAASTIHRMALSIKGDDPSM